MIFKRLQCVDGVSVSCRSFICWFCLLQCVVVRGADLVAKIRLFIRCYKQGCRIASVPMNDLIKLSAFPKRRWSFKDGWLILEAF